jgi:hypothetical protein
MQIDDAKIWRKCSSCKNPIALGAKHFLCSVSTCNSQRTGYVFCSVGCFEVHLPSARHKDAAAMEAMAPAAQAKRTIVATANTSTTGPAVASVSSSAGASAREVLIIASRLKDYIAARSEMNTSAQVMDVLSDFLRVACERAIENARSDGRKTVLDRDFAFLKKS